MTRSALFPTRTSLGFDQKLFKSVTLSATHEILDGDAISQSNTTVGLTAEPWSGGKLTLAGDRLTQDSAERIGATLGLDQQVQTHRKTGPDRSEWRGAKICGSGAPSTRRTTSCRTYRNRRSK